jgi:hypothetical protein
LRDLDLHRDVAGEWLSLHRADFDTFGWFDVVVDDAGVGTGTVRWCWSSSAVRGRPVLCAGFLGVELADGQGAIVPRAHVLIAPHSS